MISRHMVGVDLGNVLRLCDPDLGQALDPRYQSALEYLISQLDYIINTIMVAGDVF